MTYLRPLQLGDAESMADWMTDSEVTKDLAIGRFPSSIESASLFIRNSWTDRKNVHFAITNENKDYLGSISLKNIDYIDRNAEFAIVLRKEFWGTSHAYEATQLIIKYGFEKLNLIKIYLNVAGANEKAKRFYERFGFQKEGIFKKHIFVNGKYEDLNWYCIFNETFDVGGDL